MDLSDVHFTAKDVRDFFDELDIDAIIKNISMMPSDDETESSFSHNLDIDLHPQFDYLYKLNQVDIDQNNDFLKSNSEYDLNKKDELVA